MDTNTRPESGQSHPADQTGTRTRTTAAEPTINRTHSGQGHMASNVLWFVICMVLLCGALVLFSYWISDPSSGNIFALGLVCYGLTFFIPLTLLRSATAKRTEGGMQVVEH